MIFMKKNILIVTWYKSTNCGTCLQSYALYHTLSQKYNVSFLGRRTYYSLLNPEFYRKIFIKIKACIRKRKPIGNKNIDNAYSHALQVHTQKFAKFIHYNYHLQPLQNKEDYLHICKNYDVFIVGSDQLWNPSMFSRAFMLDFVPSNKKKLTYAASFGVDNIPVEYYKTYKKLLGRLDMIAVREPRAKELVSEIAGRDSTVVLDPTFLLTPSEWRDFSRQSESIEQYNIPENYIIAYFIGSSDFDHLQTAKQISKKLDCRLVVIPNRVEDYSISDPEITLVPDACSYDFVKLIDNARLVCTDSFHSVVFSFLMDTEFFVFPRFKEGDKKSQNNRLDNILTRFSLVQQKWQDSWLENIDSHLHHDYTSGYATLTEERQRCLNYLLDAIESD